jgi:TolA-binding protein
MNNNLFDVLQQIVNEHSEDILNNPKRIRGLLADMAPREPKIEKKALAKCFEMGFYTEFKNSEKTALQKGVLIDRLQNKEGFTPELCEGSVDIIVALADAQRQKPETLKEIGIAKTTSTISESIELEPNYKSAVEGYSIAIEFKDNEIDLLKFKNTEAKETLTKRDKKIRKMEDEINELQKQFMQRGIERSELQEQFDRMKSAKDGAVIAVVTLVICLMIAIGVGVVQYFDIMDNYTLLETENSALEREHSTLVKEHSTLQATYNNSKKIWVINVTGMKVGNANQDNKWITEPGVKLNASAVRYLNPVFTYDSQTSAWVTFNIKIIDGNGKLETGSNSPVGYTYSKSRQVNQGKSLVFDAYGFGNATVASFSAGIYTIELWYEGICLYSGKVTLN